MLRYGLASIALLAILRWSEGAIRLPGPDVVRILSLGGLGFGLYQILWTTGLHLDPGRRQRADHGRRPVLVAVLAVIDRRPTRSTPQKFARRGRCRSSGSCVVIAAGVGIELSGSAIGSRPDAGGRLCWATYTAFAAQVLRRHSPLVLTTWATIGGTLVLLPSGIGQLAAPGALGPEQAARSCPIVLAIAYSGLLAAALANVVVFNGVRLLGPTRVITLQSFVPPDGRRPRVRLPARADPAGPGRGRRVDHPRRGRAR